MAGSYTGAHGHSALLLANGPRTKSGWICTKIHFMNSHQNSFYEFKSYEPTKSLLDKQW